MSIQATPDIESEPAVLETPCALTMCFSRQNTAGNDTFLCWVLEFLNTSTPGLIAAFGNVSHYFSVTRDDDLFLLCKFRLVYWKFYEGKRVFWR